MWIRTTFYLIALLTRVGKIKCKFQTYLINNYMLNYGSFLKNYFYATLMIYDIILHSLCKHIAVCIA
jgi:hypothetical protein